MRYRMTFAVGLAVGYVLGSRAGRERYEQIKRAAQRVADNPRAQEFAGAMGAQASKLAEMARTKVGGTFQQRVPFLGAERSEPDTGTGWPDEEVVEKKARESGIPY
ncbi:YtxH domain-containing protein [Nonomuraea phyllanthi]|uniref:YtxH domain-containing protein n=1 Tax=Nonomuraea phyllanthi TaxID=2219224 RepID=A0A5C4WR60_9ACTN|nr:YtxH domain-containing protein [Nonomuraea phyllanthi]KAB8196113.1 YtxH domain-containing protein [Nonomuraea phyllanthi]QFY14165.1 YtxH domain-containing protein [Nonomuraea phyllanthi]